jgi:hypothetical protein
MSMKADEIKEWGKLTNIKLKQNPILIGGLIGGLGMSLGLLALLFSRFSFSIWMESPSSQTSVDVNQQNGSSTSSPAETRRSPMPTLSAPTTAPLPKPVAIAQPSEANDAIVYKGKFRVSNQTDNPIRIALLPNQSQLTTETHSDSTDPNRADSYDEPVHWDFAPQEGRTKGLLLSLPDRNLELQKGDILVGFAQDGSRRYWGPYVVGSTTDPIWDHTAQEWVLILQP